MTKIERLLSDAERDCATAFASVNDMEESNTGKVLDAFKRRRVAQRHFAPTTGYGYSDAGRDTLDLLFADIFGAEDALVRPQIASGTHALALCLAGLLLPGDHLLAATGKPYDTLDNVIGLSGDKVGSLLEAGISYSAVPLDTNGQIDAQGVLLAVKPETRVILIQRSRGYAWRNALKPQEMAEMISRVHLARPDIFILADNCYGEFVCSCEPTHIGADIAAGSLIKNPGGGLAPTGGYIAGTKRAVHRIESRLTAPGIGREIGSYAGSYQPFYQGLFMAPHTVSQALKTAILAASVFEHLGYKTSPASIAPRADIVQAIELGDPGKVIAFCRGIQNASPIDSFAVPEPWDMPGYQCPVIMAAGTFVAGASIELSADAPMRPPYSVYMQGGLTYAHGKLALFSALAAMDAEGYL
jgi:cystathionine beta-lyase family protein involved in aluminum resistance